MPGQHITHIHVQGKKPIKKIMGVTSSFLSDLKEEHLICMDGFIAHIILPVAGAHVSCQTGKTAQRK